MKIINLSKSTQILALAKVEIAVKPFAMSQEFACTPTVFKSLVSMDNYWNKFRFIMDASERIMLDSISVLPATLLSEAEAKDMIFKLKEGFIPAKIDANGKIIASTGSTPGTKAVTTDLEIITDKIPDKEFEETMDKLTKNSTDENQDLKDKVAGVKDASEGNYTEDIGGITESPSEGDEIPIESKDAPDAEKLVILQKLEDKSTSKHQTKSKN